LWGAAAFKSATLAHSWPENVLSTVYMNTP
jgi:hypothetical protein